MKYTIILALAATALAVPAPGRPNNGNQAATRAAATTTTGGAAPSGTIDASLVPTFGITPGQPSANQPGSCVGAGGKNIPCSCPPSQPDFIAKMNTFNAQGNAQGTPFNFPTDVNDQSPATQLQRVNMCIIALQNFDNTAPGVGCPAVAAPNFGVQQAALQKEQ